MNLRTNKPILFIASQPGISRVQILGSKKFQDDIANHYTQGLRIIGNEWYLVCIQNQPKQAPQPGVGTPSLGGDVPRQGAPDGGPKSKGLQSSDSPAQGVSRPAGGGLAWGNLQKICTRLEQDLNKTCKKYLPGFRQTFTSIVQDLQLNCQKKIRL